MAARRAATKVPEAGADERLLIEAAQKDPARFADLYALHFERVFAFVASRVRERAAVEDLVSEVFHSALANLKRYEWRGAPFSAWLIRIAANSVSDFFKRSAREIQDPENYDRPSGDADLEAAERRARLFRLVERLPADHRRVIVERFVEQKSIRDIARGWGRTEGAIKQLQFRALESLRGQMEREHA